MTTSPHGWPLLPCLACGQTIPWPVDPKGRPVQTRLYYTRKTCGGAGCRPQNGAPLPPRRFDEAFFRALLQAARPPGRPDRDPRPTRDEVRACRKCGASRGALYECEAGMGCVLCGTITYTAALPDWQTLTVLRRASC